MIRLFVRHTVADYSKWRAIFDAFQSVQTAHGVRGKGVYQSLDNPNDVTLWHDFDTAEAAHAFVALPELRDTMAKADVQGTPQLWFTQEK